MDTIDKEGARGGREETPPRAHGVTLLSTASFKSGKLGSREKSYLALQPTRSTPVQPMAWKPSILSAQTPVGVTR